jgi:sarcosine oxidase
MASTEAQVVVVGLGSMGSQALWQVARRGVSAIGIEQFVPGHDQGAGHGESRIIRSCYQEGPQYVPLIQAAFPLWRELEVETDQQLLTENGALFIGRADAGYVPEAIATAQQYDLPHEVLDAAQALRRYPQHRLDAGEAAFLDHRAGFLRPEAAVRAAAWRAEQLGAHVVRTARVEGIEEHEDSVEVRTAAGAFRAAQVIVAAGAWTEKLLPELGLPLWVERQVMFWFRARRPEDFAPERFPVFIREHGQDHTWYGLPTWYGVPTLDGETVKAAIHHEGPQGDPDQLDREIHPGDVAPVSELVRANLQGLDPEPVRGKTCMYTNTPDGHFVLGRPPGLRRVVLLGPMAGHGFKFASAVGKIGADLAVDGSTNLPIEFFSPARFQASVAT